MVVVLGRAPLNEGSRLTWNTVLAELVDRLVRRTYWRTLAMARTSPYGGPESRFWPTYGSQLHTRLAKRLQRFRTRRQIRSRRKGPNTWLRETWSPLDSIRLNAPSGLLPFSAKRSERPNPPWRAERAFGPTLSNLAALHILD